VHTAGTGYEAGMLTSELRPDLLLLDYLLPDINGNAVCRAVREKAELSDTRIILLSGAADPREVEELMNAGADAFVRKPFDIEQLVAKIAAMLQLA
jgi:DNA-binding response OmpR family regulator